MRLPVKFPITKGEHIVNMGNAPLKLWCYDSDKTGAEYKTFVLHSYQAVRSSGGEGTSPERTQLADHFKRTAPTGRAESGPSLLYLPTTASGLLGDCLL